MLPILLGVLALGVVACSANSNTEEKDAGPPSAPPPEPSDAVPEPGRNYSRHCLLYGPCQEDERSAAFLDYAGAVYGSGNASSFDGFLRDEERARTEKRFGPFLDASPAPAYLSSARQKFFLREAPLDYPDPPHCSDDRHFQTRQFAEDEWGKGVLLGTAHLCGGRIGDMFAEFEAEIATAPEDWIIFLENISDPITNRIQSPETKLFKRVSAALDIPLEDPIIPMPEIARRVAEKYSIKPEEFVAVFLAYSLEGDPAARVNPEAVIRLSAEQWKVDPKLLVGAILDLDKYSDTEFQKMKQESLRRYDEAISDFSPEHIRSLLKAKKKNKALYVIGSAHLDLGASVYGNNELKTKTPTH